MPESIGLQAVLEDSNFQAGLKRYLAGISDAEKKTTSAASGISATLGKMGTGYVSLGNKVWDVAGRIGTAFAVAGTAAVAAGVLIAKSALDSYASYERLGMAIESLVAKELVNTSGTEKMIAAGTVMNTLTDAQRQKLEDLRGQLVILEGTHKAQESALNNAIIKGRESSEEIAARRQRIIDLREKMEGLRGQIGALEAQDGKVVTVMKKVTEGQLSMTEAIAQAGPKAKELLGWITKLAVESPFKQEDIANSFRLAMAYGFTTKEAQDLTQTMVDFASGTGATSDSMNRIALALGQIKARGKLAGQEVMQLTETGLGVLPILAKAFGKSTAEVQAMIEKGLVPADVAIKAISESLNKDFGGAAKRQATTFSGLISSLSDLKDIGLRELFTGTFKAIQPYVAKFVDTLSSPEFMAKLSAIGEIIGTKIARAIEFVSRVISGFQTGGVGGLLGALGVSPETVAMLQSVFDTIMENLPAIEGALAGIGVVLAGAGIAAAIVAIANPITLLIAAAAALGAAWATDWGGIRTTLTQVWNDTLQPALAELWQWLQVNVPAALQTLSKFWNNTLLPALQAFWDFETQYVLPIWETIFEWLQVNIPRAIQTLSDLWNNTLLPAIRGIWAFINDPLLPLLKALVDVGIAVVHKASEALAGLWQNVLKKALDDVWGVISGPLKTAFEGFVSFVNGPLKDGLNWLGETILPKIKSVFDGISGAIRGVTDWLGTFAGKINSIPLPKLLTPGSPTPFEEGLVGVGNAIQSLATDIETLLTPTLQGLSDLLQYDLTYWLGATDRGLVGLLYEVGRLSNTAQGWAERFEAAFYMIRAAIADAAAVADGLLGTLEGIRALGTITSHVWIITHHKDVDENAPAPTPVGGGPTGRALGGPIAANTPYIVGESGPELFLSRVAGQIIPNVSQFLRQLNSTVTMLPRTMMQTGNITNLTTNNYNLSVSTLSPAESLTADFGMLEAMAGA